MKLLYRASHTNLDGITYTIYRIRLLGLTLLKWTTQHRAKASDWN